MLIFAFIIKISNMSEQVIPMTRIEIIDFVVSQFENNPRSLDADGYCAYNGAEGEHCAFGLMCENPKDLIEGESTNVLIQKRIPKIKLEFAGYSTEFYKDIQRLHDYSDNWIKTPEGNELTQRGISEVKKMKKRYN